MIQPRFTIGIDPGTVTGCGVWDRKEKRLDDVFSGSIIHVMQIIEAYSGNMEIYLEDARLISWHGGMDRSRLQGAGSVKRDCSIWEEYCEYYNIPLTKVSPKNNVTKLTSEKFSQITKWEKRTSEHSRDASMLVFGR